MSDSPGLILDEKGYFSLAGRRVVPIGVNYWPASCGVEMWPRWPAAEIQHDLDVIQSLGLNTIRFFLRWQDFEPEAGQYDPAMFERLEQILGWCSQREIFAQPSLFVGWMSGGIFHPPWREGRNLFADPFMVERATVFAQKAAAVIAPFHAHLLGIDLGNELDCLPDSQEAPPGTIIHWCRTISQAIRSEYPACLIVSGTSENPSAGDSGWRLGQQPGTDFYSVHGYPVPGWHPVDFDGMTDPFCQSFLPIYTKLTRAFGPVLVQEFGTLVTFGEQQQDPYLRAVLPASWEAGANGFLWWCLRDITARVHPYVKGRVESTLGLVDGQDHVKPGLEYVVEFARSLPDRATPDTARGDVGLYFPRHFYLRENPLNPGNVPHQLCRWLLVAHFLLEQLGHTVRIVRGDQPLDSTLHTMVIPGARLGSDEAEALEAWVSAGNKLIWHGQDSHSWGQEYIRLLGARPVDYRPARPVEVTAFGDAWTFAGYPRGIRVEVVPETATIIARDEQHLPLVLTNRVGQGVINYALPLVEEAIASVAGDRGLRDRWQAWYRHMME
jgi:hypothetical protein